MKRAIILFSVGSPRELSQSCIKQYLKQFLSDKLVVRMPSFLWQPILKTFILRTRPQRMYERYEQIFFDGNNPYILAMDNLASKLEYELNLDLHNQKIATASDANSAAFAAEHSSASSTEPSAASTSADKAYNASTEAAPSAAVHGGKVELSTREFMVRLGYAYIEPTMAEAVQECIDAGVSEITVVPLFPHYSDSTSKRPLFEIAPFKEKYPHISFKYVKSFGTEPVFVEAIKETIENGLKHVISNLNALPQINNYLHNLYPNSLTDNDITLPESKVENAEVQDLNHTMQKHKIHILFSLHSLPQSYIKLGDIYQKECEASVAAIAKALNLSPDVYSLAYQSRLGPVRWIGPYLEDEVDRLLALDKRHLLVVTPGFSVDCLETLYDLNINLRKFYLNRGGESIDVIPCLNDEMSHVKVLKEVALHKAQKLN